MGFVFYLCIKRIKLIIPKKRRRSQNVYGNRMISPQGQNTQPSSSSQQQQQ